MRAPLTAPRASLPSAAATLPTPTTRALRGFAVSVVVSVVSILALISLRSPAARLASGAAGQ